MRKELKQILKNPQGKLIAVDIDGTLTDGMFWGKEYSDEPKPNMKMIKLCEDLIRQGGHVVLFTARTPEMAIETLAWLAKYNVWHHGINFGRKCGADLYIDDKALNVDEI